MNKPKSFFLILIFLVLIILIFSFVYWSKYMKTEPEITPETEPKIDSSILAPVEPTTSEGGGGGTGNFIEEP